MRGSHQQQKLPSSSCARATRVTVRLDVLTEPLSVLAVPALPHAWLQVSALTGLSVLELCMLVAAQRLEDAGHSIFNFQVRGLHTIGSHDDRTLGLPSQVLCAGGGQVTHEHMRSLTRQQQLLDRDGTRTLTSNSFREAAARCR